MKKYAQRVRDIRNIYGEHPRQFWILVLCTFIDKIGWGIMVPFIVLYVTYKFNVGMTEAGVIFGMFSIADAGGRMFGGVLTDHLGRKCTLLLGLIASASSSLLMGLVGSIELFFASALIVGLFSSVARPAQQAMVADLLSEEKRNQGFGVLRMAFNLGTTIGTAIGGTLAVRSYLLLFICDTVASLIIAGIVILAIRETMPTSGKSESEQTMARTFGGYLDVLRDVTFTLFIGANVVMMCVYRQMNTTMTVYLRDIHAVSEQGLGYLLSVNAALVVLFQFPISRRISRHRPLIMMAVGTLLFAVGFGMYGFVSTYAFFSVAMIIITIGEMFVAPTSQALAAQLAPENMRGRYMGVFGFSRTISSAIGSFLAGLIMDHAEPRWVWYAVGLVGLVAAGGFVLLQRRVARPTDQAIRVASAPASD